MRSASESLSRVAAPNPSSPSSPYAQSHSRGVLEWMVVIEPSWPVFIACSMSSVSSPRTSPRTIRSGRIRSALITSSRCLTAPFALDVRRTCFEPHNVVLLHLQFGRVFDRDDALVRRDETGKHIEQRRLTGTSAGPTRRYSARAFTAPFSTSSIGSVNAPKRSRSSASKWGWFQTYESKE